MTRSPLVGLGLGAVTALVMVAAPPAGAEPVPAAAKYTVTGHGWGHGHGLSQYGALGAAEQGVGWKQIVRFYYPGTQLGRARGKIKVLLTADTTKDVMVDARDGLRLRRLNSGKTFALAQVRPRATRWRITPKGGRSIVAFKKGPSRWTKWTSFPGEAEFTAGNKPVTLRLPGRATAQYRGALRSADRHTVNVLPLDRYVQGVVPSEVPTAWAADAVRAQSVAARTYAAYERAHATSSAYDICDTTSCQVYGGYAAEDPAANAAVKKTRGRVVSYQGEPAFTQFSSSNGGWSSAGSQPYLVAQADPYEASSGNPYANWTATVTSKQIEKAWPVIGTLTGLSFERDGNGDFGGHVLKVMVSGSTSTATVTGDDFRSLLGLRSTYFSMAPS